MKKQIVSIIALLIVSFSFAQNGFNYKALISDNGNVLFNQVISIKFTVLENGTTSVYQETQTGNTDANGIIAFNIGEGSVVSGDFSTIDWGSNPYFLKVEINTGNGYQDFGTTELKYVPYAKFAEKAGNIFSGDFGDLSNVPAGLSDGDDVNDADHDSSNEIQTISKTGSTITLSNGGGSVTDSDTHLTDVQIGAMGYIKDPNDADHDATNELQNLSLSGTQLSITNGTGVDFTNWDTNSTDDVQAINDLSDAKTTNYGIFLGNTSGSNANSNGDLVAVGRGIMANATSADYSVGIGNNALHSLTSGFHNVALGFNAGYNLSTGNGNVFIGSNAGYNETGNYKLYIDNSSTSSPLIYGDFNTNELTINGSLAIKDGTQGVGKVFVSDANGKGHWGDLPQQNKVIALGPLNTTTTLGSQDKYLFRNAYYGTYSTSSSIMLSIVIPINLPEGTKITGVDVYYKDNTTANNYDIKFYKLSVSSYLLGNYGTYTTSGASSNIRYFHFSVNANVNSGYKYYVYMRPTSGSHWTADKESALKGIRVHYTE